MRSLCLAILYEFFRETTCDIRDVEEDSKTGMRTLPIRLGKNATLTLMTVLGIAVEAFVTQGIWWTETTGLVIETRLLLGTLIRVGLLMATYRKVLRYPKGNVWAWGFMALFGLAPILWAQADLST